MTILRVGVTYKGFAAGVIPKGSVISFTGEDLAAALFVTGRARGHEAGHGLASIFECIHRLSLIPAYLRCDRRGRVTRSRLAVELDRSEKVNLSYSLGQAMAGVFAQKCLGVDRLMHVDRYGPDNKVAFGPSRQRPDLFGRGRGGWVVIEAKGRSNQMEAGLAEKMKAQASNVGMIQGVCPWVGCGVVAQFPKPAETMKLYAIDPEPNEEAFHWEVDADRLAAAYYAPFLTALEVGRRLSSAEASVDEVETVDFGAVGVRMGLDRDPARLLRQRIGRDVVGLSGAVGEVLASRIDGERVRKDGSWFQTSWDGVFAMSDAESRQR